MAEEKASKPPKKPRKVKPAPTAAEVAERDATRSWTSWKLDVQRAIIADKRIPAASARLLIYLLHEANRETGIAIVYDSRIRDEVHGFAIDTTIYRTRKRLRDLGWLEYVPGSGLNASRYSVRADNVQGVMTRVRHLADGRREVQERRKSLRKAGIETLHSQHKEQRAERRKPISDPLHLATQATAADAWLSPSLSPSASGQRAAGTELGVALRAADVTPAAEPVAVAPQVVAEECAGCGEPATQRRRAPGSSKLFPMCDVCAEATIQLQANSASNSRRSDRTIRKSRTSAAHRITCTEDEYRRAKGDL
ncbi:hypothetical protein Q8W71_06825 [Methylobacterium sp. NEAU 140]|uniref:hypothetical protein n=1 Tax=Methylobacterium sp. NEAU 140 TaxID=3064945 RepID=UPI0027343F59|nr:hypothetical protein [Methylobacterium sp. NEAU 140]MDP4022330.1 hypothetical protein [Methylobacterium sp. NEAU 140]